MRRYSSPVLGGESWRRLRSPGPGAEIKGCCRGFQLASLLDGLSALDGLGELADGGRCLLVAEPSEHEASLAGVVVSVHRKTALLPNPWVS